MTTNDLDYTKRFKPKLGELEEIPKWLRELRFELSDVMWQDTCRRYFADIGEAKARGYKEGWDDAS